MLYYKLKSFIFSLLRISNIDDIRQPSQNTNAATSVSYFIPPRRQRSNSYPNFRSEDHLHSNTGQTTLSSTHPVRLYLSNSSGQRNVPVTSTRAAGTRDFFPFFPVFSTVFFHFLFFFSFLFFATRRRAQNSNSSNISVRISAISLAILPHRRGIRRKACTFLRRCAALVFRPATKLESRLRRNSFYAVRTPVEDAGGTWCGNRAAGWRWVGCGIFVRRTAPTGTRVLRPLA